MGKKIVVKFLGTVAARTGVDEVAMEVDGDFQAGATAVRACIDELTGGKVLYALAYNGTVMARVDPAAARIEDGDRFLVLPVGIGG